MEHGNLVATVKGIMALAFAQGMLVPEDAMAQAPEFGLEAPLGVEMGMPLDMAVSVLEARGYRPVSDYDDSLSILRSAFPNYDTAAERQDELGLFVPSVTATWGRDLVEVQPFAQVTLHREEQDVQFDVLLRAAAPLQDQEGYGSGPVFQIVVDHDYRFASWVSLGEIEVRLRSAAGRQVSCLVDGQEGEARIFLWKLPLPPTLGFIPFRTVQCGPQDIDLSRPQPPYELLQSALEDGAFRGGGGFNIMAITIEPDFDKMLVQLNRHDRSLEREVLARAMERVGATNPLPPPRTTIVDF